MKFIDVQPSLIEWGDNITLQIFTFGCNWRCRYCFQRDAVIKAPRIITEKDVIEKLISYKNKFDISHVEIIGGEPTIWMDELIEFEKKIFNLGFKIEIATNGSNSEIILKSIPYTERYLIDFKTDFKSYSDLIQKPFDKNTYIRVLEIIKKYNKNYSIRTVYIPEYHTEKRLKQMKKDIEKHIDLNKWEFHEYIYSSTALDPDFKFRNSSEKECQIIRQKIINNN